MPGLQRLGETQAFGSMLLQLLVLADWDVSATSPLVGGGVLVVARHDQCEIEVRAQGATVAEVACGVFTEAMALRGGG